METTERNLKDATSGAAASSRARDAKYDNQIAAGSGKRFEYLLKQTEIFSHFMSNSSKSPIKPRGRSKVNRGKGVRALRVQKTEREEDHELLSEALQTKEIIWFESSPSYIKNGEMRDYQVRGLNWMISLHENGINGILADEMGLGKTLQTISLLGYLKHFKNQAGPHIVVVPKSTLQNWVNEFQKWCPSTRAVCFIGDQETRNTFIRDVLLPGDWDVCVTSYEMCIREKSVFKKFNWRYMVIDEAHRIKNEKSKLSEILREFKTANRLLITGTPLQNNMHELWALLNILLPDVFNSSEDFDEWFNTNNCLGDDAITERLHTVLKPFLLRRLKSEVEKDLKPKKEINVSVGLSTLQREWYKKILSKEIDVLNGAGRVEKMRLQNILMHLRKCTNHPYLFDGAEPGPPYTTDTHLVFNSGKMVILDKLLPKLQEQGSRVLIFSQMTRMLDILEDYCLWRSYHYCRLDGQTPHEDRNRQIQEYNMDNSTKFIFLLSTRAGGLGINLATADVVIIYDSDWNPQMDLQAVDRAHRIGQKKQVRVFRFVTEHTVEERILQCAEIKLRLDNRVIQQGRNNQCSRHQILNIIRFGANHILASEDSMVTDEDIDTILERDEARTIEEKAKLDKLEEYQLQKLALDTSDENSGDNYSLYNFEGQDYRKKQREGCWSLDIPKRKRNCRYNYEPTQMGRSRPKRKPSICGNEIISISSGEDENSMNSFKTNKDKSTSSQKRSCSDDELIQNSRGKEEDGNINFIEKQKPECKPKPPSPSSCNEIDQVSSEEDSGKAIYEKLSRYHNPRKHLRFEYPSFDSVEFTKDDDRFLICSLVYKYGLDNINAYQEMHTFIRASNNKYSEFLRSCSVADLKKRCNYLIMLIRSELENEIKDKENNNRGLNSKRRRLNV